MKQLHCILILLSVAVTIGMHSTACAQTSAGALSELLHLSVDPESLARGNTTMATMPSYGSPQGQPATLRWNVDELKGDPTSQHSFSVTDRPFNGGNITSAAYTYAGSGNDGVYGVYANLRVLSATNHGATLDLGVGECMKGNFSGGLTFTGFTNKFAAGETTTGISVGTSIAYNGFDENGQGFTAGGAMRHLGFGAYNDNSVQSNGSSYYLLPPDLSIGAGYTFSFADKSHLLFAAEGHKSFALNSRVRHDFLDETPLYCGKTSALCTLNAGTEFKALMGGYNQVAVAVRAGYIVDSFNKYYSGPTFGAGFTLNHFQLNVAVFATPFADRDTPYGNTITFGLVYTTRGISTKQ